MSLEFSELPGRIERFIWGTGDHTRRPWQRGVMRVVRTVLVLGRDLALGQLTLRAMSLVYTTLLSIVPLLALSFSVLKAFGVYNQIQPLLANLLEPLGEKGAEVARRISEFIENMNVGVLGALGLTLLLYTVISLMQKIEESLNYIWHIPRPRRLGERFSRYLSVLMVGPILVFSALGITATVMNIDVVRQLLAVDVLGQVMQLVSRLTPYLLVIAAFTFVYLFIPNARVRFVPALTGGIVGGVAWQTAGWLFALFVTTSTQYAAIYSSFAILVLFMIWLYVSWLVLLFGASVAFYVQQPEYLVLSAGEPRLSNRMRERLGLAAMSLVTERFLSGRPGLSLADLTRELAAPTHVVQTVIDALEDGGLLVQGAADPPQYLPGRDPALTTVTQVMTVVRSAGEARFLSPETLPVVPAVDRLLDQLQKAAESSAGATSLRDLVTQGSRGDEAQPDSTSGRLEPRL
jgi:membrane protein